MRPVGRKTEPLTERDLEMLKEYFDTDIDQQRLADKYSMTKSMVIGRIKKYKKMMAEKEKQAAEERKISNEN